MKFVPYLTLEDFYVSPLETLSDGQTRCRTRQQMTGLDYAATGSRLMDALKRVLAICQYREPCDVANHLQVNVRKLSDAVSLNCGFGLSALIDEYKLRMVFELAQNTDLSLDEIALRSNFASNSNVCHLLARRKLPSFRDLRARRNRN